VTGGDGLVSGNDPAQLRDAAGQSLVTGAIAVVGRGGGSISEKARIAAAAGAAGLVVWDQTGRGEFPGIAGGADWPIPVVGVGGRQGTALAQVLRDQPGLQARFLAQPVAPAPPAVASFSSRGPTAEGRSKPEVVAPGVDVEAAYPGTDGAGAPRSTHVSGTSASAAHVAALALRLRVDDPALSAADVRGLLVQGARGVAGAGVFDAGAGAAVLPTSRPAVAFDPPIVSAPRQRLGSQVVRVALHDLTGAPGRYRLALRGTDGEVTPVGGEIALAAGMRTGVTVRIPGGEGAYAARLLLIPAAGGDPVASAPVVATPAPATPEEALGVPQVQVRSGYAEAEVRVGLLDRSGGALRSVPMHGVSLSLVPVGSDRPLRVAGARQPADWPAGAYRFLLARRLSNGLQIPPGRFRLRVSARGPDGTRLVRESGPFALR
jgi:hypothetical protein